LIQRGEKILLMRLVGRHEEGRHEEVLQLLVEALQLLVEALQLLVETLQDGKDY